MTLIHVLPNRELTRGIASLPWPAKSRAIGRGDQAVVQVIY